MRESIENEFETIYKQTQRMAPNFALTPAIPRIVWRNNIGTIFVQKTLKNITGKLLQYLLLADLYRELNSDLLGFLLVLLHYFAYFHQLFVQ